MEAWAKVLDIEPMVDVNKRLRLRGPFYHQRSNCIILGLKPNPIGCVVHTPVGLSVFTIRFVSLYVPKSVCVPP